MDLTKDPIRSLIWRISWPSSLGFLFATLYNMVDAWFAGNYFGTTGLAALADSFPVYFLFVITIEVGLSQGISAVVANALGSGDRDAARRFTAQGALLGLILGVAATLLGIWLVEPLFVALKAEGQELEYALAYTLPILIGGPLLVLTFAFNGALVAMGDTKTIRNLAIVGFLANPALNYAFIQAEFGLPGIAYATVLIWFGNLAYVVFKTNRAGLLDRESFALLLPRRDIVRELLTQSLPAVANMFTVGLGIYVVVYFTGVYGGTVKGAYIAATRIEQLVLLPCIGMNSAVLAITGQNLGAGNFIRARETLSTALRFGWAITIVGGLLVLLVAHPLMDMFVSGEDPKQEAETIRQGVIYLYVTVAMFPAYMILFLSMAYLQGLKKPMFALFIGLYRQIIAPILVFYPLVVILQKEPLMMWLGLLVILWSAAIIAYGYTGRVSARLGTEALVNEMDSTE